MSIPYLVGRMRLECDISKPGGSVIDKLTNETPAAWRGFPLNVELGFFSGEDETMDMTNSATFTVEFHPADFRTRPSLAGHPADPLTINTTLTPEEWKGQILYHAMVAFTAGDMALDLEGEKTKNFWIAIHRITTAGERHMLAGVEMTLHESGVAVSGPGPQQGANLIPLGANYDVSGIYELTTDIDRIYSYTKGANDTDIQSGATVLSATGTIQTVDTVATLHGTAGAEVTAIVRYPIYFTADETTALIGRDVIRRMNEPGQSITLIDRATSIAYSIFIENGDIKAVPITLG